MKNFLLSLAILLCLALSFHAQNKPDPRVIEVSGSAERWVTPDEFTFKITLLERMENKQKVTIEQQESALRQELKTLGVDEKDLSVYDISSAYIRRKKVKDVLSLKDYRLKLRDPNKIARLQDLADRLNVFRLELENSEHSEITRLRRETKIDAIKAAKDKAEYLLASLGLHAGKAVFIREEPDEVPRNQYSNSYGLVSNSNSNISVQDGVSVKDDALSFSQIRLRYVILAKFEIE